MRELQKFSSELQNIRRNIDRIMEGFFNRGEKMDNERVIFTPPVNAIDNEDNLILYVLVPFGKKEDISIDIKENVITISGKTKFNVGEKDEILREEIPVGEFSRSFKIGYSIDPSKAKASFKEGILEIILPKKEESKASKIVVE